MSSNLKKYYTNRGLLFSLLESRGEIFNPNPFYLVNNFLIVSFKNKDIAFNYYNNLLHLNISNKPEKGFLFGYNPENNTVYSKNTKSDIYALVHIASVDRYRKKTGIILDNIGYGLNTGITELYTKKILGIKESFPIETTVAKTLDKINHEALGESFFCNNATALSNAINPDNYESLLQLVDKYHNTYISLSSLYNQKFINEKYYYNSIYGREFRRSNAKLLELENKIELLENSNYTVTYDIIQTLIKIINDAKDLENDTKAKYLESLNKKLNKIFSKPEFMYLNNLTNEIAKNASVNKLVKKK